MTPVSLKRLWTVIGTLLAAYTINALLNDRGAKLVFKQALLDDRHVPNAYFSIIIIGAVLAVLTLVGRSHGRRTWDASGIGRLPAVGLDDVNTRILSGSLYQCFFFAVFIAIPAVALLQFWGQLITHGRVFPAASVQAGAAPVPGIELKTLKGVLQATSLPMNGERRCLVTSDDVYRFSSQGKPGDRTSGSPCSLTDMSGWTGGPDFIPLVSPLLLLATTAAGWAGVLMLINSLWSWKPQRLRRK